MRVLPHKLFRHGMEAVFSLSLVLICFVAILGLLSLSFPQGMNLRDLIARGEAASLRGSFPSDGRDVAITGSLKRRDQIARLSRISRKVKDKASDDIAWEDSETGMSLGSRHAIQTFDDASATIAFDEKNVLDLAENSLIVLKGFESAPDGSDRKASLIVLGGELRGSISGRGKDSLHVEVQVANGVARIRSTPDRKTPTSFRVKVNEDQTSTLSVHDGEAEVVSGGESVVVKPNQVIEVPSTGRPSAPRSLPNAPALLSPSSGARYLYRSLPPRVTFSWRDVPGANGYRFALATDRGFQEVVYETDVSEAELAFGNLSAGEFYWRVSTIMGDLEGTPSRARRFHMQQDARPPALSVVWPEGPLTEEKIVIRGTTDPGSRVFVSNLEVDVSATGQFSGEIVLKRGTNLVVVEAVDEAGNTTYESQTIKVE
jgi:mannose-6-phosphate isomerase-like protein (cupin superfamily)